MSLCEGYLSDQTEGLSAHKRRAEPQLQGKESQSLLTRSLSLILLFLIPFKVSLFNHFVFYKSAVHLVSESPHEGAGPPEEEERLLDEEVESHVEREEPMIESGMEANSDLTSGITAAFNTFKTQLEQHFTVSTHMVKKLLIGLLINDFHGP